jgi:hypothetical protein
MSSVTKVSRLRPGPRYTTDDIAGMNFEGTCALLRAVYQRKCLKGTCPECDAKRRIEAAKRG